MRLDIELADGGTQTIVTDPSWQATTDGPIRRAGIYFGETYDATKEMPGWDQPGFAAAGWVPVQVLPFRTVPSTRFLWPSATSRSAWNGSCGPSK